MRTRTTLWIGMGGVAAGVLAVGTEVLPALGFDESTRAAWFRGLVVLAGIMLLAASLLSTLRLTRTVEEVPTRVEMLAAVFRLGISLGLHDQQAAGGREGPTSE